MSGHVQSEVNNERCKTPVKMVDHRSKEIDYNMIKTEIKEEPELSQMETYVDHLKCEESQYKQDMQEAVFENMLDIEGQGLMDNEDMKYEVLEESVDIEEHELVYREDGQQEESEGTECLELMEPEEEYITMSGHVRSEVSNEHCVTPVKIVLGGKDNEHNVIKTDIKQEPELSQLSQCTEEMEACVEHLKCEVSDYREDMQEDHVLDIESRGLMGDEDMKYEVLEESIDIEEHELVYREDGQHEESEGTECLELMEPEGAGSGKKWKQTQPENIEDGSALAPGGKNITINTQVTINTSMYTATNKGNVSVNSDNDCTDTDIHVDNSDSTHWKMSIYNDGDDKCLTVKHIDHDVVKNKSNGERFSECKERLSVTIVENKETDRRETRHECDICQRQFKQAENLKRHLRTHAEERPFECEICQVRFKHKSSLKRHLVTHTGEKPFGCEICQVRFNLKDSLKRHFKSHSGKKPFRCEICEVRFNQKENLNRHLRTHTGVKPFECEICKIRFTNKCNLKTHLRTHTGERPFECKICQRKFSDTKNLKRHLRIHTGERPFVCEICQVRFKEKANLKRHLRTHTSEKLFECEICQVRFNQKGSLKKHLRTHTGERPFECEICLVRFKHKCNLKTHLNTHTGGKPFECEICQQKFNQAGHLKNHLRTHTGVRPFECEICQVRFNQKGSLNRHLRTHEKPFVCEICKVKFAQKGSLNRHLRTHTGD